MAMSTAGPVKYKEVLWRPVPELWEDNYTEPPARRFQLCDICRNIMASPDAIRRLQTKGGVQLCCGSFQETRCSLRAFILECFQNDIQDGKGAFIRADRKPDGHHEHDIQSLEILRTHTYQIPFYTARLQVEPDLGMRCSLFRVLSRSWYANLRIDDPAAQYISTRPFLADFASREALCAIGSWVPECEQSHPNCYDTEKTGLLPTRVIDVDSLQVHHTRQGETGRYAALSYCWGPCELVRGALLKENLEALKTEIHLDTLPQTVKDAIICVKRLGLRYLWIDAYCIVQDSEEDKHRELAQMADIYGRAHITLSASSAASAEDGFLATRIPPKFMGSWGRHLGYATPRAKWAHFPRLSINFCNIGTVILAAPICEHLAQEPIEKRAWTFQEKLLSPRLLIFGVETLRWQCNGMNRSAGRYSEALRHTGRPAFLNPARQSDLEKPVRLWQQVVEQYSGRSIARETDRLIALSAVASEFSRAVGHGRTYVAGLWRPARGLPFGAEFVEQLLWFASAQQDGSCLLAPRPSSYVAPSFSWASNNNRVCFRPIPGRMEFRAFVEVIDCRTTPRAVELPLGGVLDGELRVRSRMGPPAQVKRPDLTHAEALLGRRSFIVLPGLYPKHDDDDLDERGGKWWIYWDADETHPSNVFCLRVSTYVGLALVLIPDGRGRETFRRVGLLNHDVAGSRMRNQVFRNTADKFFVGQPLRDILIV